VNADFSLQRFAATHVSSKIVISGNKTLLDFSVVSHNLATLSLDADRQLGQGNLWVCEGKTQKWAAKMDTVFDAPLTIYCELGQGFCCGSISINSFLKAALVEHSSNVLSKHGLIFPTIVLP
jgi:hypothetical protein